MSVCIKYTSIYVFSQYGYGGVRELTSEMVDESTAKL